MANKKIKVFTSFSGYDSQCIALERLKKDFPEFDYTLVGWSEIDKYAIKAHNTLFPEYAECNFGDISKIDWSTVPDFDLFTYSSPCQDFSLAGRRAGGKEGSGTRSSLLWECRRAILEKKPKYLLLENVAALVTAKFIDVFNKWKTELAQYGYTNYVKILDAKNYSVPQSRKRVFMVSILGEHNDFVFPNSIKLKKFVKDILEQNVDDRYYLSEKGIKYIFGHDSFRPSINNKIAATICCGDHSYRRCDNFIEEPVIGALRGRADGDWYESEHEQRLETRKDKCTNTLTHVSKDNLVIKNEKNEDCEKTNTRIRKLTEREQYKLMDVDDEYIDKLLQSGIPSGQHGKLAGNSIVVSCLYNIFRKMFLETGPEPRKKNALF